MALVWVGSRGEATLRSSFPHTCRRCSGRPEQANLGRWVSLSLTRSPTPTPLLPPSLSTLLLYRVQQTPRLTVDLFWLCLLDHLPTYFLSPSTCLTVVVPPSFRSPGHAAAAAAGLPRVLQFSPPSFSLSLYVLVWREVTLLRTRLLFCFLTIAILPTVVGQ